MSQRHLLPLLGSLQWPGHMPLFSGPCDPSLAHAGVSTVLSFFEHAQKAFFSFPTLAPYLTHIFALPHCSTASSVRACAHAPMRTHPMLVHLCVTVCGLPWPNSPSHSTWLVPFHAIVTSCDCSPSFHTPQHGLA